MNEIFSIIAYNLLIAFVIALSVYVYLKWRIKKRNDAYLQNLMNDPEVMKNFDQKGTDRYYRKLAEYDKKHPFKAFKRKFKDKIKWLL